MRRRRTKSVLVGRGPNTAYVNQDAVKRARLAVNEAARRGRDLSGCFVLVTEQSCEVVDLVAALETRRGLPYGPVVSLLLFHMGSDDGYVQCVHTGASCRALGDEMFAVRVGEGVVS